MSDLQAYLASKYLSGAKADAILARAESEEGVKRKKKKRKVDQGSERIVAAGGGLIIDDEDGMGWARKAKDEEEEDGRPVVEERRGHFKASKATAWSTVRPADPKTPSPEPEDEDPVIVSTTEDLTPSAPVSRGGLQSTADLRREHERRMAEQEAKRAKNERELAQRKKERRERGEEGEDDDDPHATVYRDSSGRRIDMKLEKAEKAKQEREKLEKEMKKMEWGKGLVQKEDKAARKREEERMAHKPIARYIDDEDMNNEMRDQDRWNDPAAAFLTNKDKKKTTSKYPRYAGPPPPPNRFGIPPGYRWDGVDRGTGFEAKMMQRGNQIKMRAAEAHAWRTDEM